MFYGVGVPNVSGLGTGFQHHGPQHRFINFQDGGVITCKIDRILPLDLPYHPVPTRSRNEGV